MSARTVQRPQAEKKKINSRNEFELCYIRHQYFRKVNFNPTHTDMEPYTKITDHLAKNTYYMYRNLFQTVGFECEDVINIARIHLISFLGLFSIEKLPIKKYKEFLASFKDKYAAEPTPHKILEKNRANLTLFLKQRMEDVVRVCRQKARNIKGMPTEEFFVFYGPHKPPKILRTLLENHEALGFRKLDLAVFKSIRKKAGLTGTASFRFDGNWYVCVPIEHKALGLVDFSGADMDPYDNMHNMTPEQIFFNTEDEEVWKSKQEEFNSYPNHRKIRMIKKFISENKNDPKFKDELRAARKLLKSMESNVR